MIPAATVDKASLFRLTPPDRFWPGTGTALALFLFFSFLCFGLGRLKNKKRRLLHLRSCHWKDTAHHLLVTKADFCLNGLSVIGTKIKAVIAVVAIVIAT